MLNPFKDVNWNPGRQERRKFARSLMIGFPIIAAILLLALRTGSGEWKLLPLWIGAIGAGFGAILWLLPIVARPFYFIWFGISCCMGIVIGNLLLAVLFYLIVTPIGIALRLAGKTPISKEPDKSVKTYWKNAETAVDSSRYYSQF